MTTTTNKPAHEIEHAVSDLLHDAGDRIGEFTDESMRTLGKRIEHLGKAMQKHPLLTIGLGVAAGYVLARILHRD